MATKSKDKAKQRGYDTNLAAEFYVLSSLHRLGLTANLTLGNKKGVDIVVVRDAGEAITVEVKGLAGTTSWPINRIDKPTSNHFFVFVCYNGKIATPSEGPEAYIVPSKELRPLLYRAPVGRTFVQRRTIKKKTGERYLHAWDLIEAASADGRKSATTLKRAPRQKKAR